MPSLLLLLQASKLTAVSQERVDSVLQENDALRTNLAALEQVTSQEHLWIQEGGEEEVSSG